MEALFLDEKEGELSFRLGVRAACWLRRDLAGREAVMRLVRHAYGIRSRAVHTGSILPKTGKRSTAEVLRECDNLVGEAVRLFLRRGKPDWNRVVLQ